MADEYEIYKNKRPDACAMGVVEREAIFRTRHDVVDACRIAFGDESPDAADDVRLRAEE
jgi:hypothetical protein